MNDLKQLLQQKLVRRRQFERLLRNMNRSIPPERELEHKRQIMLLEPQEVKAYADHRDLSRDETIDLLFSVIEWYWNGYDSVGLWDDIEESDTNDLIT